MAKSRPAMVRLFLMRAPACFFTLSVSTAWATPLQISEMSPRFKPPTPSQRVAAIGSTGALPDELRRALEPGQYFQPVPQPEPDDWLANHPEPGQAFEQFVRLRPCGKACLPKCAVGAQYCCHGERRRNSQSQSDDRYFHMVSLNVHSLNPDTEEPIRNHERSVVPVNHVPVDQGSRCPLGARG